MNLKSILGGLVVCTSLFACNSNSEGTGEDSQYSSVNKSSADVEVEHHENKALWTTTGFVHPESVILSPDSSYFFVSNIGNDEGEENPDGFISKLSPEGRIINLKWVDGLRSPKGLCVTNNKLYVSAVTDLVEIDIASGEVVNRYTSDSVEFLNDVACDDKGNVYVSGMFESAVYKLDNNGRFEQWYQNDELDHPNGLLVVNDTMYIGGWGRVDDSKVKEDSVGYFFRLSVDDKNLSKVTTDKPGKLDGIQTKGEEFLVSSWKAGEVFNVKANGEYIKVLDTDPSVGDILYLENKEMLILPMNFQNKVVAYQLK